MAEGAIIGRGGRFRLPRSFVWFLAFIVLLTGAFFAYRWYYPRDAAPRARPELARVERPAQPKATRASTPAPQPVATAPAPAPQAVEPVLATTVTEPSLPSPLPTVNADTQRLVDMLKRLRPNARGDGIPIYLRGRSGTIYHIYYNGDGRSPELRAIMIRDLPTHADAFIPTSRVNLSAMLIWDRGLDGTVDNGENGSPSAILPEERQTHYQRPIDGVQEARGLENEATFQARYEAMRADILAGQSR